jgi:hypothetical protein
MGRELVEAVQVVGADAPVEAGAEALGGVGGVLGDVAGYLLGRQLPRLVVTGRDVADVELLTPPRIAVRLAIEGRTMHPDRRNCQPQRLLKAGPAGGRLRRPSSAGSTTVGAENRRTIQFSMEGPG